MSQVVDLVPKQRNESLIAGLEELLERAKSGDADGLAYVELRPDQTFRVGKLGYCSSLEMAGALSFALHDLITKA